MAADRVSIEKYLSTTYRPDCDYIDGYLQGRNVGERDHGRAQLLVAAALFRWESDRGIVTCTSLRIQLNPTRIRVADVCAILRSEPKEQILTHSPFLCIEILSRDDTFRSLQDRIDDYLAFGVKNVWAIEPRTRLARIYTKAGVADVADGVLRTADPEIAVPLSEIFES